MNLSLIAAFSWLIVTNVTGMFPSRHKHWPQAYVLIALGLPILAWVVWDNGPWIGLAVFVGACSVLRWPVRYLLRWCMAPLRKTACDDGQGG